MTPFLENLTIRPIQENEYHLARELALAGLEERWGWIDPTLNPDLEQIDVTFREGIFLVALQDGRIIATGGLLPEDEHSCRIVRMSVVLQHRNQGVGSAILDCLIEEAMLRGYDRIVVETTAAWTDAVRFYLNRGFSSTGIHEGDHNFELLI